MFLILLAFVAVIGIALAATLAARHNAATTTSFGPRSLYRGSTPPPGIHLTTFTLRNQDGALVSTRELRGKVVVFTFLDSACKDSCPIIAGVIGAADRRLSPPERKGVAAFALTVNPRADTPGHVRRFLRARGALGRLDFLLGTVKKLQPLWHKFGVVSAYQSGNVDIHSADVRIFDRHGIWVSTLRPGMDLTANNLLHDVRVASES